MYLNKTYNSSYNFVAPEIEADADKKIEVKFPTFESLTPTLADNACAVDINCKDNVIDMGTLAANATLTINKTDNTTEGDRITVKVKTTATETLTFSGDVTCPVITGVAGKTKVIALVFVGAKFIATAAAIQID